MYSGFQLAKKYLKYYYHASNGKGHGVHSPFIFDFIKNVLNDKTLYPVFNDIETVRKELLNDKRKIHITDPGAGSAMIEGNTRMVSQVAATSLKPVKYAQLIYRIARYYNSNIIVELGTSFGITTSYLAAAPNADVYTMEGAEEISAIASETFKKLKLDNIKIIQGSFRNTLPGLVSRISRPGLVFIDGDHRKGPLLEYFHSLLKISSPDTIFIIDDIHWSEEMEDAWDEIKLHPDVTSTIDLFFIGIVLLRKGFKAKQHFSIRF